MKNLNPLPPANAFEWRRFTEEEKERRGGKPLFPHAEIVRSEAATKAVNKKRETDPTYGTLPSLKPKEFHVYNKAISSKGKKK